MFAWNLYCRVKQGLRNHFIWKHFFRKKILSFRYFIIDLFWINFGPLKMFGSVVLHTAVILSTFEIEINCFVTFWDSVRLFQVLGFYSWPSLWRHAEFSLRAEIENSKERDCITDKPSVVQSWCTRHAFWLMSIWLQLGIVPRIEFVGFTYTKVKLDMGHLKKSLGKLLK